MATPVRLTLPGHRITESWSDLAVPVLLSSLPQAMRDAVAGGANVRAYMGPVEIPRVIRSSAIILRLPTTVPYLDQVVTLEAAEEPRYGDSHPFGRNATWAGYVGAWDFEHGLTGGIPDESGNGLDLARGATTPAEPLPSPLGAPSPTPIRADSGSMEWQRRWIYSGDAIGDAEQYTVVLSQWNNRSVWQPAAGGSGYVGLWVGQSPTWDGDNGVHLQAWGATYRLRYNGGANDFVAGANFVQQSWDRGVYQVSGSTARVGSNNGISSPVTVPRTLGLGGINRIVFGAGDNAPNNKPSATMQNHSALADALITPSYWSDDRISIDRQAWISPATLWTVEEILPSGGILLAQQQRLSMGGW